MPGITETLAQDEWWYAQDGLPVHLDDMELEYLENLLAYLRRGAGRLRRHALWREYLAAMKAGHGSEATLRRWERALEDDPTAWLERRPLVARLRHLIAVYGALDAEAVAEPAEVESPLWRALERG